MRVSLFLTVCLSFLFLSCESKTNSEEENVSLTLLGGGATIYDQGINAYSFETPELSQEESRSFFRGRAFFRDPWVIAPASTASRDGLGPVFNARSCEACHLKDGRGRPPENSEPFTTMLVRISIPGEGEHGGPVAVPNYGGQIQNFSVPGVPAEANPKVRYETITGSFDDGSSYELLKPSYVLADPKFGALPTNILTSPRVAPGMVGLGLLEAIPEADILEQADPDDLDGDGISGKANYVWDVQAGAASLGRFGWKANQPNLMQQTAGAFLGDIGITSSLFSTENCAANQLDCAAAANGGDPELMAVILEDTAFYSSTLAVPAQRDGGTVDVLEGQKLFAAVKCNECHTPTWTTGESEISTALSNQKIHPFTDLLLHDMGDELADGRPDFLANGNEWRTPPLWGIGLLETVNGHSRLMHDGRARNIEEAILWHGGEGEDSRDRYKALSESDRKLLIKFMESL